jgi:hypothetical protein
MQFGEGFEYKPRCGANRVAVPKQDALRSSYIIIAAQSRVPPHTLIGFFREYFPITRLATREYGWQSLDGRRLEGRLWLMKRPPPS